MIGVDGGGGVRIEATSWSERPGSKDEWHAYGIRNQGCLRLEMDAAVVDEYQLAYVPGLLQSEDYMRALFPNSWRRPTDAEIDQDVQARLFRQRRLTEDPTLELVTMVDEPARIGNPRRAAGYGPVTAEN
jgi:hypothetical protein